MNMITSKLPLLLCCVALMHPEANADAELTRFGTALNNVIPSLEKLETMRDPDTPHPSFTRALHYITTNQMLPALRDFYPKIGSLGGGCGAVDSQYFEMLGRLFYKTWDTLRGVPPSIFDNCRAGIYIVNKAEFIRSRVWQLPEQKRIDFVTAFEHVTAAIIDVQARVEHALNEAIGLQDKSTGKRPRSPGESSGGNHRRREHHASESYDHMDLD